MPNLKALTFAASLFTTSVALGQNLLLNGSFEDDGPTTVLGITTVNSSAISHWSLQTTSSSSAYTVFLAPGSNEPNPADGSHLLNIGGFGTTKGVGDLWQDFATIPGQTYDVAFFFGRGNNDPTPTENVSVRASIFDITSGVPSGPALSFIDSGNAAGTGTVGNLAQIVFQFTATGNTSRLHLDDTTVSSAASLQLDAASVVSVVVPVPEPSGMLLAISAGALLLMRRRRG